MKKIEKTATEIQAMSINERQEYFKSLDYAPERLNVSAFQSSSVLPLSGVITDIQEKEYEITTNGVVNKQTGLRIIAKDEAGQEFSCSLSRCALNSIEKTETKKFLDLAEYTFDRNNNVRIAGQRIGDVVNNIVLVYDLIGKRFSAEKINVFALPFGLKTQNKHEAQEKTTIMSGYRVKLQ